MTVPSPRDAAVALLLCFSAVASLVLASPRPSVAQVPPATAPAPARGIAVAARPETSITMLAFSRDGRTLAGGSRDHTVKTWESITGKPGPTLGRHSSPVMAVQFATEGALLLSAAKEIKRWNSRTWQLLETIELEKWSQPNKACFSPDGKRLAMITVTPDSQGRLLIYDIASGLQLYDVAVTGISSSLQFTPDGKSIAVGTIWMDAKAKGGSIQFFDVATGRLDRTLPAPGASVSALAFSTDGKLLAYSGMQKVVVVNSADGSAVKEFPGHAGPIEAIAFSPDGKLLLSGGEGPGFQMPHQWMLMSETRLWETTTGRLTWANVGELARVKSVAFSPDGSLLARCDDRSVLVRPVGKEGMGWLHYTEPGGIGEDISHARQTRQVESMRQNSKAAMPASSEALHKNAARSQVTFLANAVETYKVTVNSYPSGLGDLIQPPADAAAAKRWVGPYIREKPLPDPWGTEHRYLSPGKRNPKSFDVWSAGPDGQDGTDDDIGNWEGKPAAVDVPRGS